MSSGSLIPSKKLPWVLLWFHAPPPGDQVQPGLTEVPIQHLPAQAPRSVGEGGHAVDAQLDDVVPGDHQVLGQTLDRDLARADPGFVRVLRILRNVETLAQEISLAREVYGTIRPFHLCHIVQQDLLSRMEQAVGRLEAPASYSPGHGHEKDGARLLLELAEGEVLDDSPAPAVLDRFGQHSGTHDLRADLSAPEALEQRGHRRGLAEDFDRGKRLLPLFPGIGLLRRFSLLTRRLPLALLPDLPGDLLHLLDLSHDLPLPRNTPGLRTRRRCKPSRCTEYCSTIHKAGYFVKISVPG